MIRTLKLMLMSVLVFGSNAFAGFDSGFFSTGYTGGEGSVIAAVEIKDKGLFNLIVSIQFLRKPRESKIYKSDEYEQLIDRLLIESRGIALQKMLEAKDLKLTDLAQLKNTIEAEISNKITELKNRYVPGKDVEVVFSLSNFFLMEPRKI